MRKKISAEYFRLYRLANIDRKREIERKSRQKSDVRARKLTYLSEYYQKNKERIKILRRLAHKRNPEKERARDKVMYELHAGRLLRLSCEVCGNPKSQAHHEDYSKPLKVKWLCQKHHGERHRIS